MSYAELASADAFLSSDNPVKRSVSLTSSSRRPTTSATNHHRNPSGGNTFMSRSPNLGLNVSFLKSSSNSPLIDRKLLNSNDDSNATAAATRNGML